MLISYINPTIPIPTPGYNWEDKNYSYCEDGEQGLEDPTVRDIQEHYLDPSWTREK